MTSKSIYLGQLRVESTHNQSGQVVLSDAPIDNNGQGQAFSPTDSVATALASCMLTIMGIVAERKGLAIEGAMAAVTKTMASHPRRISAIEILMTMPANNLLIEDKDLLERSAYTCPVAKSLHPDIEQKIKFIWL